VRQFEHHSTAQIRKEHAGKCGRGTGAKDNHRVRHFGSVLSQRSEIDKVGEEQQGSNAVQYDQKCNCTACVTITLPFQEQRVDPNDVDFLFEIGWRHGHFANLIE
jgi:hypothetical protein